jgi:hypothetical protein
MAARENEADKRPRQACAGSFTPTSGVLFNPISAIVYVNVTAAGNMTFHTLDGNSTVMALATTPGFYVFEIQCDTLTWTGTMAVMVCYNF